MTLYLPCLDALNSVSTRKRPCYNFADLRLQLYQTLGYVRCPRVTRSLFGILHAELNVRPELISKDRLRILERRLGLGPVRGAVDVVTGVRVVVGHRLQIE